MLDSVEGLYHRQAARLYLMRFDHPGILSTMTVSYFDEEDPGFALRAPMAPWSLNEIREIYQNSSPGDSSLYRPAVGVPNI